MGGKGWKQNWAQNTGTSDSCRVVSVPIIIDKRDQTSVKKDEGKPFPF